MRMRLLLLLLGGDDDGRFETGGRQGGGSASTRISFAARPPPLLPGPAGRRLTSATAVILSVVGRPLRFSLASTPWLSEAEDEEEPNGSWLAAGVNKRLARRSRTAGAKAIVDVTLAKERGSDAEEARRPAAAAAAAVGGWLCLLRPTSAREDDDADEGSEGLRRLGLPVLRGSLPG